MSYTFNDLEELKSWLNENVEEAWTADGLDEAIIGIVDMPGSQPVILYDKDLCVAAIMRSHGCDADTATEHLEFNTFGAYIGPTGPAYAMLIKPNGPAAEGFGIEVELDKQEDENP